MYTSQPQLYFEITSDKNIKTVPRTPAAIENVLKTNWQGQARFTLTDHE